jgi:hypothetical protein
MLSQYMYLFISLNNLSVRIYIKSEFESKVKEKTH